MHTITSPTRRGGHERAPGNGGLVAQSGDHGRGEHGGGGPEGCGAGHQEEAGAQEP